VFRGVCCPAVVVNPPEPGVARRHFLVCGVEGNRCEQPRGSTDRSVIAFARPVPLGERYREPAFRAVMFRGRCGDRSLHVVSLPDRDDATGPVE
jgi:hypothetical protein